MLPIQVRQVIPEQLLLHSSFGPCILLQNTGWCLQGVLPREEERLLAWWLEFKLASLNGESRARCPGRCRPVINPSGPLGSPLYRERGRGGHGPHSFSCPCEAVWHSPGALENSQHGDKPLSCCNPSSSAVCPALPLPPSTSWRSHRGDGVVFKASWRAETQTAAFCRDKGARNTRSSSWKHSVDWFK